MEIINIRKNKKPDNVADNPGLLPYGSNVGAPSISIENVDGWKASKLQKVNHQFKSKFEEMKKDYDLLMEEFLWNEMIYNLYYGNDESVFLSLIGPNEWNKKYVGSFKLNSDNKWLKI
jgi:hypothetical protein